MRDMKALCVGHLPGLLAKVTLAVNRHQAILTEGSARFDIVLLCHMMEPAEGHKLADDLRVVTPSSTIVYLRDWDDLGMKEMRDDNFLPKLVQEVAPPTMHVKRQKAG